MTDLVQFLAARLDEDEAAAIAAARADGSGGITGHSQWAARYGTVVDADDPDWAIFTDTLDEFGAHIARHDPARVLREVAAGRAILALHEVHSEPEIQNIDHIDKRWNTGWVERREIGIIYWCEVCDYDRDYGHIGSSQEGCATLRHLAAVYSGHPDYDPAWA